MASTLTNRALAISAFLSPAATSPTTASSARLSGSVLARGADRRDGDRKGLRGTERPAEGFGGHFVAPIDRDVMAIPEVVWTI
jgi:hypothetical protein